MSIHLKGLFRRLQPKLTRAYHFICISFQLLKPASSISNLYHPSQSLSLLALIQYIKTIPNTEFHISATRFSKEHMCVCSSIWEEVSAKVPTDNSLFCFKSLPTDTVGKAQTLLLTMLISIASQFLHALHLPTCYFLT